MADNTLSTAASLLYEMKGPMQVLYPRDHFLLAEWSGVGAEDPSSGRITPGQTGSIPTDNREIFSGSGVRVPLDLTQMQAGGWPGETGTVNVPIPPPFTQATIQLRDFVQPTSISLDLEEDSMDNSAAQGLATLVRKAREAMAEVVNDTMNTTSNGLLALADSTQGSAGGLVLITAAGTDLDKLYPGKIVDVLTATTGADPGQGKRRKINTITDVTLPVITFSTTSQASDGGSGNITLANTVGVYIAGSYGNAMNGIEDAANISGTDTFETVVRSNFPQFKAVDGRAGVTTVAPLSDPMIDAALELGKRNGAFRWDFAIGDPNSINVYKNGKQSQVNYTPDTATLTSGFQGIQYAGNGQPIALVPERRHGSGMVKFLRRDSARLYGRKLGPDFEDSTGAIFQRFSRALPKEMWLVDRLQWGWENPGSIVRLDNLSKS